MMHWGIKNDEYSSQKYSLKYLVMKYTKMSREGVLKKRSADKFWLMAASLIKLYCTEISCKDAIRLQHGCKRWWEQK